MQENTTTCPECGNNTWLIEDRSTITETVTVYHHSEHQFPDSADGSGTLACVKVKRDHPDPGDLLHKCRGPGCSEQIDVETGYCSTKCRELKNEQ